MAPITRSKAPRFTTSLPVTPEDAPTLPKPPNFPNLRENDAISIPDSDDSFDTVPPVYTIDLSLPPAQRYVQVAKDHKAVIDGLPSLFDELFDNTKLPRKLFHVIARLCLTRLYSKEQTEEIRGISKVTGVPVYLMVAYNVLLDLFMGCTSGGALVKEPGKREKRMMHFRTLDWGMPALRKAIVQYEFKDQPDGDIIARTVSYVGFVGVLTGVRQGLSVSLNFRPYHNDHSKVGNVKFYSHHLLVLLGLRPSICAHLRDFILPGSKRRLKRKEKEKEPQLNVPSQTLTDIAREFPSKPTTAAYLTFCDGAQTLVLEKDRVSATHLLSSSFIAVTNHDTSYEQRSTPEAQPAHVKQARTSKFGIGIRDIVDESMQRKGAMVSKWEKRARKLRQQGREEWVSVDMLKDWLLEDPVTNKETHAIAIMDPKMGVFRWVRAFDQENWADSDEEGEASEA